MCSQDRILVDIISIRLAASWVVRSEPQRVEVLVDGDNGRELVVIRESRKSRLDQFPGDGYGMTWLNM